MDWDDLRTFLAIARHGTLSAAARALGATQPTMGRRLAAMEKRTGARLLQRLPGGYALTPLGERVLGNAERIEAEALAAELVIRGQDVTLAVMLRLTTVDVLAARVVTPAIVALQARHPGMVVEVIPDTRSFSLARREADIAVRLGRFDSHEIVARRIGAFAMGIYAPRQAIGTDAAVSRLVTVQEDQEHLPEAKWLADLFPGAEPVFRSNSRDAQLWAVKAGSGIAALPRFMGDGEPELIRIREDQPDLLREIWMGVHRDLRAMPRVRAVMDALAESVRARAAALVPAPVGG
ncbi:MAG: LysR family transcriptional regulator [Thiohalobacteraceae bacterium]